MPNYRRAFVENSIVFLTVNTYDRNPILIDSIVLLKESIKESRRFFDYQIIGLVVMPDHFHIMIAPIDIHEYPEIITSIKYNFSKNIKHKSSSNPVNESRQKKREKGIWQRRYWEHTIRNQEDLNRHLDYIHFNPVKHRLVSAVQAWKYSTFHDYVKRGYYESDWGSEEDSVSLREMDWG